MSRKNKCDMDCLNCKFSDCINNGDVSEEEKSFSFYLDSCLKAEIRQDEIRQIDDPKYRATARYRQTPKGKDMLHRMNTSVLAKERYKKYENSEKGKERRKKFEAKAERVAYRKSYMREYMKEYRKRKEKELENSKNQ